MGQNSSSKNAFKGPGYTLSGSGNAYNHETHGQKVNNQQRQERGDKIRSGTSKNKVKMSVVSKSADLLKLNGTTKQNKQTKALVTEEQREMQRQQRLAAAQQRGNDWENRLAKNRENRAKIKLQDEQENGDYVTRHDSKSSQNQKIQENSASSYDVEGQSNFTEVQKKESANEVQNLQQKVDFNGFNPFQAQINSSHNARAAVTLGSANNVINSSLTQRDSINSSDFRISENENFAESPDEEAVAVVTSLLHNAIESCNVEEINKALERVDLLSAVDKRLLLEQNMAAEIVHARELVAFLTTKTNKCSDDPTTERRPLCGGEESLTRKERFDQAKDLDKR